jgi:prepilin-type processing-associated H-X9-DG protein
MEDHGWYIPLMPFIEQANLANAGDPDLALSTPENYAVRTAKIPTHECPTDIGIQENEFDSLGWARVRTNYVVNAGNTLYGQIDFPGPCPGTTGSSNCFFKGAPFAPAKVTPIGNITDGTSNTLMMSEILVLPGTIEWSGPYSDTTKAMGGQTFTGWKTPNSKLGDGVARLGWGWLEDQRAGFEAQGIAIPVQVPNMRAPTREGSLYLLASYQDSSSVKKQYYGVKSHHPGGVNASMCDGSVDYVQDDVSPAIWQALSSAWGEELIPEN